MFHSERLHQSCRKSNDGVMFEHALEEVTTPGPTTPYRPIVQYKTTKDLKGYEEEHAEYIKPRERKSGGTSIICPSAVLTMLSLFLGQYLAHKVSNRW